MSDIFREIDLAASGRGREIAVQLGARESAQRNGMFHCCNPSHEDRNPSMSVSKDGLAHCFSCQENYNLISMARALGHDKPVEKLCSLLGIRYTVSRKMGGKRGR